MVLHSSWLASPPIFVNLQCSDCCACNSRCIAGRQAGHLQPPAHLTSCFSPASRLQHAGLHRPRLRREPAACRGGGAERRQARGDQVLDGAELVGCTMCMLSAPCAGCRAWARCTCCVAAVPALLLPCLPAWPARFARTSVCRLKRPRAPFFPANRLAQLAFAGQPTLSALRFRAGMPAMRRGGAASTTL